MGKRLISIYILKILNEHGSMKNPMYHKEIIRKLESEYSISISSRTLIEYIKELKEEGLVEGRKGVYKVNDFTDIEVRLLIDGILFSKHIPEEDAKELINKLKGLSGKNLRNRISNIHYLSEMHRVENRSLYEIIDVLDEAISRRKQVEITNCIYDTRGNLIDKNKRVVSPFYIVTSRSLYYLICYAGRNDDVENRRIDRISNVRILDDAAVDIRDLKNYKDIGFSLSNYMNEHIYMFSGKSERVTLEVKKQAIGDVIDWVGKDYNLLSEKEDKITINFRVNINSMYYWALQYGGVAEVIKPRELRDRIRVGLEEMIKKYNK